MGALFGMNRPEERTKLSLHMEEGGPFRPPTLGPQVCRSLERKKNRAFGSSFYDFSEHFQHVFGETVCFEHVHVDSGIAPLLWMLEH